MRIRWLRKALQNLDEEAAYLSQQSPQVARRFVESVNAAVNRLAEHPAMGRPGRVQGTRELVITDFPYLVPYRVRNQSVEVLRMFHTSRTPPTRW